MIHLIILSGLAILKMNSILVMVILMVGLPGKQQCVHLNVRSPFRQDFALGVYSFQ